MTVKVLQGTGGTIKTKQNKTTQHNTKQNKTKMLQTDVSAMVGVVQHFEK